MNSRIAFTTVLLFIVCRGISQPEIISITPESVFANEVITISGNQLAGITSFELGNRNLDINSIVYNDGNLLLISLPNNIAHGVYNMLLKSGSITGNNFTLTISGPTITAIAPEWQETDYRITIFTSRIDTILALKFGNKLADLSTIQYVDGENEFSIEVPYVNAIGSYPIEIVTVHDFTPAYPFSISGLNIPKINSVLPSIAKNGSNVTISGINLGSVTGVSFGNTIASSSSIIYIDNQTFSIDIPFLSVGNNNIKVYTKRGESNALAFQVGMPTPSITEITPLEVNIGDYGTITGENLNTATAIVLGDVTTTGLSFISLNQIGFIIPNESKTGQLTVVTPYGNVVSSTIIYVNTVTSIRAATVESIKEDEIKITHYEDGKLILQFEFDYNKLIIRDLLGKTIFETDNISKGNLEIPVCNPSRLLILYGQKGDNTIWRKFIYP